MFSICAMERDIGACPKRGISNVSSRKKNPKVCITPRSFYFVDVLARKVSQDQRNRETLILLR